MAINTPMTRRGFLGFGAKMVGAALGAGGLLINRSEDADAYNSMWHALPQLQRNQKIVDATYRDLGLVGQTCKNWVRSVVSRSSGGHVIIPSNAPDENGWYWQQDQHVVGVCKRPEYIRFGEIIQMHWRNPSNGNVTPHTVIVIGVSPSGMEWVDANWFNDLTVRTHSVSYSAFRAQAVLYSVYYIL